MLQLNVIVKYMLDSTDENSPKLKPENNEVVVEFDEEAQLKIDIIHTLLEPCDRKTYGKRLKEAAEKLGKSKRTVHPIVRQGFRFLRCGLMVGVVGVFYLLVRWWNIKKLHKHKYSIDRMYKRTLTLSVAIAL